MGQEMVERALHLHPGAIELAPVDGVRQVRMIALEGLHHEAQVRPHRLGRERLRRDGRSGE
ncbi:hypothetical protein D7Y21_07945 [Corallococcus sp. AB045]|nr:hypothetical protein D7Y21_07945 [Corallococcus sp. AB045]